MPVRRTLRIGLGLSLSLWLAGCVGHRPPVSSRPAPLAARVALSDDELWKLYEEAVTAARYPQAAAISTSLVPIQTTTPGLRWDDQGRVLMVTWTKAQYYSGAEGQTRTFDHGDVWLTAVPSVQRFCRALGLPPDQHTLRLEQLLGLPPNAGYDAFVELWIDPRDFFRPCADPEIIDRECTVNLSVGPSPPSSCPWADSFASQTGARWLTVTQAHLDWMCANWTKTYVADPRKSYPWTGLGYTYDWGQPNPVGASEFVAPKGTTVLIESVTPTTEYCR